MRRSSSVDLIFPSHRIVACWVCCTIPPSAYVDVERGVLCGVQLIVLTSSIIDSLVVAVAAQVA